MVYKGATDYIELIFVQKGKKKKKPPNTQRQKAGERQESKIQKSRKKLRQEISIIHTQDQGEKRARKRREHLKVFPHSPGDNRIETNNKHSMRLLRSLKRQQWYGDWLLPVLRERNILVLGTRDRSTAPSSQRRTDSGRGSRP